MKKILPILILLFFSLFLVGASFVAESVFAQTSVNSFQPEEGAWVEDSDVTFAGKNATRATDLIDYVLANYQWSGFGTGQANNPFTAIWAGVRNIVYALLTLAILVAAAMIIITRGRSVAVKQFIGRFVMVVVLVTLSFSIVQFIYQLSDIVTGFFLRDMNGNRITARDLLYIAFNYQDFVGYRRFGGIYDESVGVSLLLVKLTAATYYAMFLVLMIRKIILWFFIIISPIFPVLLLFPLIRNSAKIWIGEFFRWTLYGPLFVMLLGGLVGFWQRWNFDSPIPLNYLPCNVLEGEVAKRPVFQQPVDPVDSGKPVFDPQRFSEYPTAINILLGGPCQQVTAVNNLNNSQSFLQYIVALIMLWAVILLPWVLLRIFLDYFYNFNFGESKLAGYLSRIKTPPVLEQYGIGFRRAPPQPGSRPPVMPSFGAGLAREIPEYTAAGAEMTESALATDREFATALEQNLAGANAQMRELRSAQGQLGKSVSALSSAATSLEAYREATEADRQTVSALTGVSVPTMQDVVRYETGFLSASNPYQAKAHQAMEAISRVAGVSTVMTEAERSKFNQVRESLVKDAMSGNVAAVAALKAIDAMNPGVLETKEANLSDYEAVANITSLGLTDDLTSEQKIEKIERELSQEAQSGNVVAQTLLNTVKSVEEHYKSVATSINSSQFQALDRITSLAKDSTLTQVDKVKTIVRELENASKSGNPLAAVALDVLTSQGAQSHPEVVKISELEAINNIMKIASVTNMTDEQKLTQIKNGLAQESGAGNNLATAILKTITVAETSNVNGQQIQSVSRIASIAKDTNLSQAERVKTMVSQLQTAVKEGNGLAAVMLNTLVTQGGETHPEAVRTADLTAVSNVLSLSSVSNLTDEQKLVQIKNGLAQESGAGNNLATSILGAITTKTTTEGQKLNFSQFQDVGKIMTLTKNQALSEKEKISRMKLELESLARSGNPLASAMLDSISATENRLPDVNKVQKVNLADYEEVRKTWRENYRRLEPPVGGDGRPQTTKAWVQSDVASIDQAMKMLSSQNAEEVKKGRQMVSKILPFLLLGGFSKAEILAYLKAKQEAAKSVAEDLEKEEKEKETLVEVERKGEEKKDKAMTLEEETPDEKKQEAPPAPPPVKDTHQD